MQQTKFDQWLKECFIYETHLYVFRLPKKGLPKWVQVYEFEDASQEDHKYKLVVKSHKKVPSIIALLKASHLMYSTRVVARHHWYNKFIAAEGKSFTLRMILRIILSVSLFYIARWIYLFSQNIEFMELVKNAINDFI